MRDFIKQLFRTKPLSETGEDNNSLPPCLQHPTGQGMPRFTSALDRGRAAHNKNRTGAVSLWDAGDLYEAITSPVLPYYNDPCNETKPCNVNHEAAITHTSAECTITSYDTSTSDTSGCCE